MITMLSNRQLRKLVRKVYGVNSQYAKNLKQAYKRAEREIKGEISQFIASGDSWSGKASKDDIEEIKGQLQRLNDDDVRPLVSIFDKALTLGHPKNSDVETARIAVPMINVAKQQHQWIRRLAGWVPQKVQQASHQQAQVTPSYHRLPPNYDVMLQRTVSRQVTSYSANSNQINGNIQTTINRIRKVAQVAATNTDAKIDWPKKVDHILTGNNVSDGASGTATRIIRTQACRYLCKGMVSDFKARGVRQYTFLSLEAENTCADCAEMDGDTFDVDDAQEGVNLPPMHPNCQCIIKEVEETDTDDMPSVDDLMETEDDL